MGLLVYYRLQKNNYMFYTCISRGPIPSVNDYSQQIRSWINLLQISDRVENNVGKEGYTSVTYIWLPILTE